MYGAPPQQPQPYGAPQQAPYGAGYGYQYGYGYGAPARPDIKNSVGGQSIALMILLGVDAFISILATIAFGWRYSLLTKLDSDPTSVAQTTIDNSDKFVKAVSGLSGLFQIATVVLVMTWYWAARSNAGSYAPSRMTMGRGWSIGGWFVPLGFFVIPCVVANDIRKGTYDRRERSGRAGVVLGVWWSLWVLAWFLGIAVGMAMVGKNKNVDPAGYLQGLKDSAATEVVAEPLRLLAAIALIVFVAMITKAQKERNGSGDWFGGPAEVHPGARAFGTPAGYYPGAMAPGQMPMPGMPAGYPQPPMAPYGQAPAPMAPPVQPAVPTPGHPPVPQYTPVTAPATVQDRAPEMPTVAAPVQDAVPAAEPQEQAPAAEAPTAALVQNQAPAAEAPLVAVVQDQVPAAEAPTVAAVQEQSPAAGAPTVAAVQDQVPAAEAPTAALPVDEARGASETAQAPTAPSTEPQPSAKPADPTEGLVPPS